MYKFRVHISATAKIPNQILLLFGISDQLPFSFESRISTVSGQFHANQFANEICVWLWDI